MIPKDINSYYRLHSKFYDVTRWVFLFGRNSLSDFLPQLPNNAQILDLGCGTGKHLKELRNRYPDAEIIGLDVSIDMLNRINEPSITLKNETYTNESFEPQFFDLIICSYTLSMMPDIDKKLDFIMNHLKKKGRLLVVDFDSTPFKWFSKWMEKNHVHFDSELFKKLDNRFDIEFTEVNKGYFGLYTYTTYFGKNMRV